MTSLNFLRRVPFHSGIHFDRTLRIVQRPTSFANCPVSTTSPTKALHLHCFRQPPLSLIHSRPFSTRGERKNRPGEFGGLQVQMTKKRSFRVVKGIALMGLGALLFFGFLLWHGVTTLRSSANTWALYRFFDLTLRPDVDPRVPPILEPLTVIGVLRYPLTESPDVVYFYCCDRIGNLHRFRVPLQEFGSKLERILADRPPVPAGPTVSTETSLES